MSIQQLAENYINAGLSIIPITCDGSKSPALETWDPYKEEAADNQTLQSWFGNGQKRGLGIVCGFISGNLEVIDLDDRELTLAYLEWLKDEEPELYSCLTIVRTPKNGAHVIYRCAKIEGNQKLARRAKEDGRPKTLIETRGTNGYIVAVGSPVEVHELRKPYKLIHGALTSIQRIPTKARDKLIEKARSFNEYLDIPKPASAIRKTMDEPTGNRPGDDFNNRASWAEVLEPHGWKRVKEKGSTTYWSKPSKSGRGHSATTNHNGRDLLYVFTTDGYPFQPDTGYTKFTAFALLNYEGSISEAAKDLANKGYGTPRDNAPKNSDAHSAPEEWKDPQPIVASTCPEILPDYLPSPYREYVESIIWATQTPPTMAAVLILSILATCLQRRFEIYDYPESDWREPLSLWVLVALPPGSNKSQVIKALYMPLLEWEKTKANSMKRELTLHKAKKAVLRRKIEKLEKQLSDTTDKHEALQLEEDLQELSNELAEELYSPRLFTTDTTPEKLQDMMVQQGERMACLADEGGLFNIITGLYSGGRANIDVFLQGHSGSPVRVDRVSREAHLDRPALTLGLTVQPHVVEKLSGEDAEDFRERGGLGRFLYCMPTSNIGYRDYSLRRKTARQLAENYRQAIHRLLDIPNLEDDKPRKLWLSDEASASFTRFQQWSELQLRPAGSMDDIQDWASKIRGAALRIAGLLHVAEFGEQNMEVSQETMEKAQDLCVALAKHAKTAFAVMFGVSEFEDAGKLLSWLKEEHPTSFKIRLLQRGSRFSRWKKERLYAALNELESCGYLKRVTEDCRGREVTTFLTHPALRKTQT